MTCARRLATTVTLGAIALALAWGSLGSVAAPVSAADTVPEAMSVACAPLTEADAAGLDGVAPIQSLAQGNVFDHGPPRSILTVATRPDPIAQVVQPDAAQAIAGVDLGSNALVGLFIGRWPQPGHQVTIQSARVTDAGVCLTAQLSGPPPGQDAAGAETYPYHVISLPLDQLPTAAGTAWTVVGTDGVEIAATTFPR